MLNVGVVLVLLSACVHGPPSAPSEPTLLFASGFEGVEVGAPVWDTEPLIGTDTETGFSWPIDILGADGSGLHYIADAHKQAVSSALVQVEGHTGELTTALYSQEAYEAKDDTQCPYEILDIQDGKRDLYVRYWMKLGPGGLDQLDTWRALFEWKTKGYEEEHGFRLIAYVYTDLDGVPYWHWQGDLDPEHPVWEIDNRSIPVPINEWFLTEYAWHWSEQGDGVATWKINGELVGEARGKTTRAGEPIDFIMLTQIYGDGNPKEQWVDDIEIWSEPPSEADRARVGAK